MTIVTNMIGAAGWYAIGALMLVVVGLIVGLALSRAAAIGDRQRVDTDGLEDQPAARARIDEDGAVILEFPRQFRLIKGALDSTGDDVDRDCWPDDDHGPVAA